MPQMEIMWAARHLSITLNGRNLDSGCEERVWSRYGMWCPEII